MTISATELRRQVLAHGFTPIPCRGKVPKVGSWQKVTVDDETIKKWGRIHGAETTGVRIERTLCAIDVDCLDAQLVESLAALADKLLPRLFVDGLIRHGRKPKEAWFLRTTEPFTRFASRKWVHPEAADDSVPVQVEIFGGASPRHFGCFGPHSYNDDGSVAVMYQWDDDATPATVHLDELPAYTPAEILKVCDAFDEVCAAAGYVQIGKPFTGGEPERLHDIDDATRFDMASGGSIGWEEFKAEVLGARGEYVRCSGSFTGDRSRVNTQTCTGVEMPDGRVAVKDFMTEALHFHVDDVKVEPETVMTAFAEAMSQIVPNLDLVSDPAGPQVAPAPNWPRWRLPPDANHDAALQWLQNEYAFCKRGSGGRGAILPIHPTGEQSELSELSLVSDMRGHDLIIPPAKPGGKAERISPVRTWMMRPEKQRVGGARMRPDRPRPIYHEDGENWLNTYAPPLHVEGGSPVMFWRFLEHLLPDEEERRWFAEWLAHKVQHPEVPGPAVVMVARGTFGTGRGTLFDILGKLFGQRYIKPVPFDMLTGRNAGARFNDWGASALIVTIDEASSGDDDSHSVRARVTAYENLKSLVDPAAEKVRRFEPKGRAAFEQISYASYLIATNNPDALKIPANDRRFAVLQNGDPMDSAFAYQLRAWISAPGNIGSLYRALSDAEITVFAPYDAPPMFDGKSEMIELSNTAIDRAITEALEAMPGEVVNMSLVVNMAGRFLPNKPTNWEAIVEHSARPRLFPVGGKYTRPMLRTKRERAYCRSRSKAAMYGATSADALHRELEKSATVV